METITLSDGTEREVPTEDELQDLKFRSDERKKQRVELEEEKTKLQEELLKLSDKDHNFNKLKEKTKNKEDEIKKSTEELDEAKKVFVERQTLEYEQDALSALAGTDEKEKEKILHYYNNELTTTAITKNEIMEKMVKAHKLAIEPSKYNPINQVVNHSGRGAEVENQSESGVSKEMRQKVFGVSDDDAKKYGKGWQPKF